MRNFANNKPAGMKNLKTKRTVLALALTLSATVLPSTPVMARSFWQTALADGAGCLGLAEFGLLGCALGGAAGSLAIAAPRRSRVGSDASRAVATA